MVYCNREQRRARSWAGDVIHRCGSSLILLVLCVMNVLSD